MRKPFGAWVVAITALVGPSAAMAGQAGPSVTFAKDVAPILYKSCVECHRPTMFAPMSLVTYEDVRPWARAIKRRVSAREMPPWTADSAPGYFKNDPRLSEKEIATIARWVDAGAPRGVDADMPKVPQFAAEGWTIGQPDIVFTMDQEWEIPAEGTVSYLNFRIPTKLAEDKWIQAYEIRPSSRQHVHHVVASAQPVGVGSAEGQRRGFSLGNIVPSKPGVVLPAGVGRLLPANSEIVLQMHYTTNGIPAKDRTSIGFIFAKEPPAKVVGGLGNLTKSDFVIPPQDGNYEMRVSTTLTEDKLLTTMMPHMHARGKDMTYIAHYADGRSETLLSVPKYDFNWQITYELAQPKLLPKGTRVEVIAHFDNSANNMFNPDPAQEVRWGDQTWEEMMIGATTTLEDPNAPRGGRQTSDQQP